MNISIRLRQILLIGFLIFYPFRSISSTTVFALNSPSGAGESNHAIYIPLAIKQCDTQLNYEIGEGVPPEDVNVVNLGICAAQFNIHRNYGGDIAPGVKHTITVKIVATGLGNQEPGGGGACCTALDENGARPFFDVKHPDWEGNKISPGPWSGEINLQKIAAHEYTHAWQYSLGCLDIHHQPLGDWLNEGIAEYVAYDAYIRQGFMTADQVREFQLNSAEYTGELDYPLEELEGPGSPIWSGHVGYLAVEKLITDSPMNILSVRFVCEQIKEGVSTEQAFESAFGINKADFYENFPIYIESLMNP